MSVWFRFLKICVFTEQRDTDDQAQSSADLSAMRLSSTVLLVASALAAPVANGAAPPKHWGGPRFAGKVAFVTGGESGIGLASVEAFYYECARVMLCGYDPKKTEAVFNNITALPKPTNCPPDQPEPALSWSAFDIRNQTAVADAIGATIAAFGALDIAVNNAGTGSGDDKEVGDDDFLEAWNVSGAMSVNVDGTLTTMNLVLRHWLDSNTSGTMVNVASICGELPMCMPQYTTSKYAMMGFTQQAAVKYARRGIRINLVAPGPVNTAMLRNGRAEDDPVWLAMKKEIESKMPSVRHTTAARLPAPSCHLHVCACSQRRLAMARTQLNPLRA